MNAKFIVTVFLTAVFITGSSFGQSGLNIQWQKCLGGSGNEFAGEVYALPDGGFIVAGSTTSNNGDITLNRGATDAWIIRLNNQGGIVWQKTFGGSANDYAYSVKQTSDAGFIFSGESKSIDGDLTGIQETGAWLVKLDSDGNMQWQKRFPLDTLEMGNHILRSSSGNYYVTGPSEKGGFSGCQRGCGYIGLLKLNESGALLKKGYYFDFGSSGNELAELVDGKIAVVGWARDRATSRQAAIAVVDSSSLQPLWTNLYPPMNGISNYNSVAGDDYGNPVVFDTDGGFNPQLGSNWYVAKFDIDGNTLWAKQYSGATSAHDWGYSLRNARLGSFFLAGASQSTDSYFGGNHGNFDAAIMRISTQGEVLTSRVFGGSSVDFATSIDMIDKYTIVFAGHTYSNDGDVTGNHGNSDIWVVKVQELPRYNVIHPILYFDANNNGVKDPAENLFQSQNSASAISVKASDTTRAVFFGGSSFARVDTGIYTSSVDFRDKNYFIINPSVHLSNFNSYQNVDTVYFGINYSNLVNDLSISVIPSTNLRVGREIAYHIIYRNDGTSTQSGQVRLIKSPLFSLVSSQPAVDQVLGDTLLWNFSDLPIYSVGSIVVNLQAPTSISVGDTLTSITTVSSPAIDTTPMDNWALINQIVTGPFDPNNKSENHSGTLFEQDLQQGELLVYTIRFQNIGNDTAFNIVVRDTLSALLDVTSLRFLETSHPATAALKNNNQLIWNFDNILLPDSTTNSAASNGYVSFSIKPKSTFVTGDTIKNSASIYFDYNPPIKTNVEKTRVSNTNTNICAGSTVIFTSKQTGISYQWQVNAGNGYENITDNATYQGTGTNRLQISGPSSSWYGYTYRCEVNTGSAAAYSQQYTLKFANIWSGAIDNLWSNPANWSCGKVPDQNTDVVINAGLPNYPEVNSNISVRSLTIKPGGTVSVKSGFAITITK